MTILGLFLLLAPAATIADECPGLQRYVWRLGLARRTVARVAREPLVERFCEAPPRSGLENARLELRGPGGKVLYSARVHVPGQLEFDLLREDGKELDGGAPDDPAPLVSARLPARLPAKGARVVFLPDKGRRPLAEGPP